jgi:hypothetical protein
MKHIEILLSVAFIPSPLTNDEQDFAVLKWIKNSDHKPMESIIHSLFTCHSQPVNYTQ